MAPAATPALAQIGTTTRPSAFQVSPAVAVLLLIGLAVVGYILWKVRRED